MITTERLKKLKDNYNLHIGVKNLIMNKEGMNLYFDILIKESIENDLKHSMVDLYNEESKREE